MTTDKIQSFVKNKLIKHKKKIEFSLIVLAGIATVLVSLQLSLLIFNTATTKQPIVGLKLSNTPVGTANNTKLKKYVSDTIRADGDRLVIVKAGPYTTKASLRQLGANFNSKATTHDLIKAGRTGNLWQQIKFQDQALFGNKAIITKYQIDSKDTVAYITTIDHKITTAPTNAYFQLQANKAVVRPDKSGISVNIQSSLKSINNIKRDTQQLTLPITESPAPINAAALDAIKPQVDNIIARPLVLSAGDSNVTLSSQQLIDLIEPKVTPTTGGKNQVTLSFNEQKLNSTVDGLLKQAEVPAQPRQVVRGRVINPGHSGLQAEGDQSKIQLLGAILKRESGNSTSDTVVIRMTKIDTPTQPAPTPSAANPKNVPAGSKGLVYLTVDDGPGLYTENFLVVLKRMHVHATFYLIGKNVDIYPQTAVRIVADGHVLGNHSFAHTDLRRLNPIALAKDLSDTQNSIKKASGVIPTTFRPPYGAQNAQVINAAAAAGLTDNLWSVDPRDWARPGATVITQRVLGGLQPGAVILLHILSQQTIDALPSIIDGIRAQGYTLS
ncbi:MAG: hypothetical protein NVS1B10_05120 [Candidatus Saccharimonadales bacterium]